MFGKFYSCASGHSKPRREQFETGDALANCFEQLENRNMLTGFHVDFSGLAATDYTDTEILVRFDDAVNVEDVQQQYVRGEIGLPAPLVVRRDQGWDGFRADSRLFEIPVLPGQSVEDLVHYFNSLTSVDYAEPNYRVISQAVPNDQYYSLQWGMQDMNAESAWDTRTDASSVIVGVIDSGVQYNHPDLADNIWTNSAEIPNNGIDDDNNGYVDDFYGYDFDNEDSNPIDDNGHGTHVAGTIGAVADNGIGVAGVAWNASLMSLKVIGNGSNADVARAIDYATDNGAKITNNSYGYAGTNVPGSQVMSDAIGRAKNAGVLYIVAAGNSRTGIPASDMDGNFNSWPAEESKVHDNVITVAAIDEGGGFASYSHWGDESVQIAAPGTSIASTYINNGYVYSSGTSMAAPQVAGAAALLWAERPDLSYLDIKAALLDNARPDHLSLVGSGVLDLGASMAAVSTGTPNEGPTAVNDSAVVAEDSAVAIAVLDNDSDPEGDTLTVESFSQPANGTVTSNNNVLTYTPDANYNGGDSFTYTINDGNGNVDSATVSLTVNPVNDNPVAGDDSASTDEDVSVDVDVLANDSDIDGDTLSVSSVGSAANGTVVNNGDGTVTYTPDPGFFGSDTFSYSVTDGTASDTGNVTVTVDEVIDSTSGIGYSGTAIDVTHVWKTINLPVSFNNPVVVAGGSTRDGGHQGVVRVQNVTSNSFQIRFQEWDYRDGSHTTENIGYLVVEAGEHILTDGTRLVAGTVSMTNETNNTFSYGTTFSSAPLVIAQTMTNNDPAAVVERIRNVGTSTFQMRFNEEEAADGVHGTETVGFIAIDQGTATSGDISLNAVTTGNTVTHANTTVEFGSIGGSENPVILSDMQTRDGGDAASLRHRSQTSTSVTVWVEEEASRDSELNHTTEVAGVLAMEAGVLVAGSPLRAAPGLTATGGAGQSVDVMDVRSLLGDAVRYWETAGYDVGSLAQLEIVVSDLRHDAIGMQSGNTIYVDSNAAGHGWYVDADVSSVERFSGMDLYTTVVHELGHVLGLSDTYDLAAAGDVMYGYLAAGHRHDSLVDLAPPDSMVDAAVESWFRDGWI